MTMYFPTSVTRTHTLPSPTDWTELASIGTDDPDVRYGYARFANGATLSRHTTRGGVTETTYLDPTDIQYEMLVRLAQAALDLHLGIRES